MTRVFVYTIVILLEPIGDWLYRQDQSSRSQFTCVRVGDFIFNQEIAAFRATDSHPPTLVVIFFLYCTMLNEVDEADLFEDYDCDF